MKKMLIKDLGKVVTGNTPSKRNAEFYDSADIRFIKPDLISVSGITSIEKAKEYLSEKARNKARVVSKDTILVSCIGNIGKVGYVTTDEVAFNQQLNAIIPNEKVLPRYLAYVIIANQKRLEAIANAPVVPLVNKTQFENFDVVIHDSLDEQERITKILDNLSSSIALKQTLLIEYNRLIKSRFVEMFGDPGLNTNGYPVEKLSSIAEYYNGLTYRPDNVSDEGMIVLRSSNIQESKLDFKNIVRVDCKVKENKLVRDNDILMCSRNGSARLVGKVALINDLSEDMTFGAFMMIIRSDYYAYLMTYFQLDAFRRQIATGATTTINQITGRMLNNVKLPLPEINSVKEFELFVQQVDKLKFAVQKSLDETQTLFDSLMQEYFG